MSYLDSKVPPVRDSRLKLGISFGGCARDLLDCSQKGCLLSCKRSFTQTGSCQMFLSLQMVMTIPKSVTIMHGPVGCGSQSNMLDFAARNGSAARGVDRKNVIWTSTNLSEVDVINGGEGKLRQAILEAERDFRPDVIFVASTCTPSIIGDDIDEVADSLRDQISAKIVPLHCPGFKTRVVATAYDTVYHGLAKYLDLEPKPYIDFKPLNKFDPKYEIESRKYAYMKSRTVNLVNASSIGAPDEKELTRLLKAMDLNVRVYTEYSSVDEFRMLSEASLNISMCNVHDDYLLDYLKERYSIPYIIHNMPIGIRNTREWLLAVAEATGDTEKIKNIIQREEEELMEALEPLRPQLKGRRVLLSGGVIRVACMASLLKELGLEVIGVRPYHYDNLSDPIYEMLDREFPGINVNVSSSQMFELVNILEREKPDIVFTHSGSNAWAAKTGTVSIPLFSPNKNYFAYAGAYDIAVSIARALKNTAFQKNIKENISLPLKKEWFEKDPYSYIQQDASEA